MTSSTDTEGTAALATAAVRVFAATGEVVGAGFAVGPGLVATCAHVVAEAIGVDADDRRLPTAEVPIDFPLLPTDARYAARVRRWLPITSDGGGDVAVLELVDADMTSITAPPLWRADEPWGREFRMLGFPIEMDDGVWVSGEFRAPQGTGWLQLQAATGGQPITAGFSGAAVWDADSGSVVGMADRRRYTPTAFMIPIDDVLGVDPGLLPNPYRGLERFEEDDAHLFHGREADIERVTAALQQRSFVAVAGRSGTGKSSLVSAGVIPRLRAQGMRIATFRLAGDAVNRLSTPPLPTQALVAQNDSTDRLPALVAELAQRSAQGSDGAPGSTTRLADSVPEEGLLIFPDQFEDLAATAPGQAKALLRWLLELTAAGNGNGDNRIRVLLTLRWEALDDLVDDELATMLDGATVALAPIGREQLRQVIRGPSRTPPASLSTRNSSSASSTTPCTSRADCRCWSRCSPSCGSNAAADGCRRPTTSGSVGQADRSPDGPSGRLPGSPHRTSPRTPVGCSCCSRCRRPPATASCDRSSRCPISRNYAASQGIWHETGLSSSAVDPTAAKPPSWPTRR